MFEKRLKELSKKIGEKELSKFYILTHKKHHREIYFQNNKKAIEFIEKKVDIPSNQFKKTKRIAYLLIKLRILQPFLKKIKLSSELGDDIFVAGQVKCFDLHEKMVISFPIHKKNKGIFLKSKEFQKKLFEKGIAPEIIKLDEEIPYTEEKLLKDYEGGRNVEIFRKLMNFYEKEGIKEVPLKDYVKSLKNIMEENKIENDYVKRTLEKLSKSNKKILLTKLHGDFAKENILIDNKNEPLFIDWNPREGVIIESLIRFFRGEDNFLENKEFIKILKEAFPKEIQKDIELYLLLHNISSIIKSKK